MIFGAVLAGGIGSRMGSDLPKQFLTLGGKPIIIITIEKLLELNELAFIYIAIHKDWKNYFMEIINKYDVCDKRLRVVLGGDTRIDSIYNIVYAIEHDGRAINKDDIIVFHDAVRPFVTKQILLDSINGAQEYKSVVASIPVVDTMVLSENGENVHDIPNRHKLYHAQTPASFNLQIFRDAINQLTEEERLIITGIFQICMVKGMPINMTSGNSNNIKITTDADLHMAEAFYKVICNAT